MKKLGIILGVAMLLCVVLAAQTMAAPSVSVKYQGVVFSSWYYSIPQVELAVSLSDYFSLILQGGPSIDPLFVGAVVQGGLRCYLTPDGFRPFATIYGGLWWYGGTIYPLVAGTAGLEFLADSGFRVAGEAGVMYVDSDFPFTFALSMGYSF